VTRTLWAFGGALVAVSVPLALSAATTWLLVPAHLTLGAVVCVGAAAEAWRGRPGRARLWGFLYLVATAVFFGALEAGAVVRGSSDWAWAVPFTGALLWGWFPPVFAGLAGWWASGRRARR
jgi:hypothetical protein